jgi:hypothetical protein
MSRSSLDVVCDAGPLIHLDELNCTLHIRPDLLEEIIARVESEIAG